MREWIQKKRRGSRGKGVKGGVVLSYEKNAPPHWCITSKKLNKKVLVAKILQQISYSKGLRFLKGLVLAKYRSNGKIKAKFVFYVLIFFLRFFNFFPRKGS